MNLNRLYLLNICKKNSNKFSTYNVIHKKLFLKLSEAYDYDNDINIINAILIISPKYFNISLIFVMV